MIKRGKLIIYDRGHLAGSVASSSPHPRQSPSVVVRTVNSVLEQPPLGLAGRVLLSLGMPRSRAAVSSIATCLDHLSCLALFALLKCLPPLPPCSRLPSFFLSLQVRPTRTHQPQPPCYISKARCNPPCLTRPSTCLHLDAIDRLGIDLRLFLHAFSLQFPTSFSSSLQAAQQPREELDF